MITTLLHELQHKHQPGCQNHPCPTRSMTVNQQLATLAVHCKATSLLLVSYSNLCGILKFWNSNGSLPYRFPASIPIFADAPYFWAALALGFPTGIQQLICLTAQLWQLEAGGHIFSDSFNKRVRFHDIYQSWHETCNVWIVIIPPPATIKPSK